MAAVVVPTIFPKPEIQDLMNVPEVFCDLALIREHGEVVRIMLCAERYPGSNTVDLVGKLFMPRTGFIRSLHWASTEFLLSGRAH